MFLYTLYLYVRVCYTNGCLYSNVTLGDGPKHVEILKIKAKIQLRLVECIYTYWYAMHGTMNQKNEAKSYLNCRHIQASKATDFLRQL
jgi:hypothetical protein